MSIPLCYSTEGKVDILMPCPTKIRNLDAILDKKISEY